MRTYILKTWRDILARKGQFAALVLLVALGVSSYVAFVEAQQNLEASAQTAYRELRFADFTVSVMGAPRSAVHKIAALPGVEAVEGRLIVDTGMKTATGQGTVRLIGVPENRRPAVDDLLLTGGRHLQQGDGDVGLLQTKFAQDTGRAPGGTLVVRTDGTEHAIRIVGTVASPEYMFVTRAKGEIPSTDFTVMWMPQAHLERLFGRPNTVNDVAVLLEPGARRAEVIARVEDVLEPYRIVATTPAEDQPSNFALQEEIGQNEVMASIMPTLILVISALSLSIALSRLVQSQRGEIGLAKALGYADWQVLVHYLLFALFIAVGGCVLGFVVGHLLAIAITAEYTSLLGVPYLSSAVHLDVVFVSIALSVGVCLVAGLWPAWRSSRLAPAVAMHPDPNLAMSGGRTPLVERLFAPVLPRSFTFRIPLRNVFRARRRSAYTVIGIAFAVLLTLGTWAFFDSIDYLMGPRFRQSENWDVSAVFSAQMGEGFVRDVGRWDGIERVQPARILPAKLRVGVATHEGAITAMAPAADFHGFEIARGEPAEQALRAGGLLLPEPVARKLGVGVGDAVLVKTPYRDEEVSLEVRAVTREALATPVYTSLTTGARLVGEAAPSYNALYLDIDGRKADEIRARLYELPGAEQVMILDRTLQQLRDMMAFSYFFFGVLLAFGFAMAFVVIYNTFTANVLERTREIATMRTIGEDGAHLALMVTLENLLLALVGIPLGLWLGLRTADLVLAAMSSEQFSFDIVVKPMTFVYVTLLSLLVVLLSEIPPIRRIFRLDLAEATKVIE